MYRVARIAQPGILYKASFSRHLLLPPRPLYLTAAFTLQPQASHTTTSAAVVASASGMPATSPSQLAATASLVVGVAVAATMLNSWRLSHKPILHGISSNFLQEVLARCPIVHSEYHVHPLLANRHVETIVAAKLRRSPNVEYTRETLRMDDGGTVTVDTEDSDQARALPVNAPVMLILPGLTGGSHDRYVQHMVVSARQAGFRAVVFNSRGTSDSPVTSPQFYSASFTGDLRVVVEHVAAKYPSSAMTAIGYSLGGNILVRYLGEQGANTPIQAAVSLCNPFTLPIADENWRKGFNKVYDWNLANSLRSLSFDHLDLFEGSDKPYDLELARRAKTIREFDDAVTRVSFGFPSVDAYYAGSSSALSIPNVAIPLLCVQADNDPIAPKEAIPYDAIAANPNTALVVTPTGGHLGWMAGRDGALGAPWTDEVVTEFFTAVFSVKYETSEANVKTAATA